MVIIYEDHHLLVVNKPAGLVVHPTYKHAAGTLWDMLLEHLTGQESDGWRPPDEPDEPGWQYAPEHVRLMLRERRLARCQQECGWLARPVLLHRLDKETSGVLTLARTAAAARHLARQFHTHTIEKTYLAVVHRGAPAWAKPRAPFTIALTRFDGTIKLLDEPLDLAAYRDRDVTLLLDGPLQRDPAERRRCVVGPAGQAAATRLRVLTAWDEYALLAVQPVTGRTHQIRAHLAAAGYGLIGDSTYAPPAPDGSPAAALARQFLHAASLTLRDYPANHPHTFHAPLPADLAQWLTAYGPTHWQALGES